MIDPDDYFTQSYFNDYVDPVSRKKKCRLWYGPTSGKYGVAYVQGKRVPAHKLSYILNKGPVPDGMMVLHTCDEPLCVNVRHLELGDRHDNWANMICSGKHRSVPKLGDNCALEILRLFYSGSSYRELADLFDVRLRTIRAITSGRRYKHVYREFLSSQAELDAQNGSREVVPDQEGQP